MGGFLIELNVLVALLERALPDDGNFTDFHQRRDVEVFAFFCQFEAVEECSTGGMVACCLDFSLPKYAPAGMGMPEASQSSMALKRTGAPSIWSSFGLANEEYAAGTAGS